MRRKNEEPKGTRTRFYYARTNDETKFPVVTVCLKHNPNNGEVSRGIAVCAMNYESEQKRTKKIGRNIAETRARYSLVNNLIHLNITEKAMNNMHPDARDFLVANNMRHMCNSRPYLTSLERKLLKFDSQVQPMKTKRPAILPVEDGWIRKISNKIKEWWKDDSWYYNHPDF